MSTENNSRVIFSDQLRRLMAEKGETQQTLAANIGVTQGMVSKWLRGADPKGETLSMLAQHYSVTIDQLLTGQKTDYAARKKRGAERIMLAKEAAEKYDSAELRQFGFEKELGNMTAEDVLEELDQERKKRRKIMIELLNIKIRLGELIAELGENTQKGDTP